MWSPQGKSLDSGGLGFRGLDLYVYYPLSMILEIYPGTPKPDNVCRL